MCFSGHEYAVDNLEFAEHVDPENEHVKVVQLLPYLFQSLKYLITVA